MSVDKPALGRHQVEWSVARETINKEGGKSLSELNFKLNMFFSHLTCCLLYPFTSIELSGDIVHTNKRSATLFLCISLNS